MNIDKYLQYSFYTSFFAVIASVTLQALEQAMKAQKESIGVALLFL
jgi:hypothetical protein